MYIDTEGIIIKQVKSVNNRSMLLLFSKKYGKISVGSNVLSKNSKKSSLAFKPFTHGRYELFKSNHSYNINSAEVIRSFYKIGEDIEKYMACSYVLELTEKVLPEDAAAPKLFELFLDFLDIIERRKNKYDSLILAYQIKMLQYNGTMPEIVRCVHCQKAYQKETFYFSIPDGGILCRDCKTSNNCNDSLIYEVSFAIMSVLQFIAENPIKNFEKLAIEEQALFQLKEIFKAYMKYHLDIEKLKSEEYLL